MIFNPLVPIVLEDERCLLRPLEKMDSKLLLDFVIKEADIWQFSQQQIQDEQGLNAYISMSMDRQKAELPHYAFIVYDKKAQKYAGSTRFYDINGIQDTLKIGYTWYGKAFQGTGLNKHCKYLLLAYAFEQLRADRVAFHADLNNIKSIAAMKSLGCKEEGILRSDMKRADGTRRDSMVLSLLQNEWFSEVKPMLFQRINQK